jgi:hypothetical protein
MHYTAENPAGIVLPHRVLSTATRIEFSDQAAIYLLTLGAFDVVIRVDYNNVVILRTGDGVHSPIFSYSPSAVRKGLQQQQIDILLWYTCNHLLLMIAIVWKKVTFKRLQSNL